MGRISRRTLLGLSAGGAAGLVVGTGSAASASAALADSRAPAALAALEDKIRDGMARYRIPGVAVGLWSRGFQYVRGFGVTDVSNPVPVTGDTVFRVASNTKTFTATAAMRLVERGLLDLDHPVGRYLPGFRAAYGPVTVRELFKHTAGWLGDFFLDTGPGDDALATYVAAMNDLPQLTPPGTTFAYNNAALAVAGRIIELVTGETYEAAVRRSVLDPLALRHTAYFLDDIPGASVAQPHGIDPATLEPVSVPAAFETPRSFGPFGGLISSAADLLRWARFHLGHTDVRLLSPRTLQLMRSRPGPGGTLFVELDGVGLSWMIRPTASDPKVIQHGGDLPGQHSGFLMVPSRDFALTVLTNCETGPALLGELFSDDWALKRFAGVGNLPAVARPLTDTALAAYAGDYAFTEIEPDGSTLSVELAAIPDGGGLLIRSGGTDALRLAFYRRDYVRVLYPDGSDTFSRADFVRDRQGAVAWLRMGGRLYRRSALGAAVRAAQGDGSVPAPNTVPHVRLG